jgi:hypothetical protein
MMRVPRRLLKIETDNNKIPDLPEFNLGDSVKFSYKGKNVHGYIRRINKTTITLDSEIGRIRASPTRLMSIEIEEPLNIKKINKLKFLENDKKLSYHISNSSIIESLSYNLIISIKSEIMDLAKGLRSHNNNLINIATNNIALLFTEYYNLPPVKIHTKGKRVKDKKNRQTLGVHRTRDVGGENQRSSISVYSRTATNRYVKLKIYLNTRINTSL